MNLADKPCYPHKVKYLKEDGYLEDSISVYSGLTFRERLTIALAGNADIIRYPSSANVFEENARNIIRQADAIIKQLEQV